MAKRGLKKRINSQGWDMPDISSSILYASSLCQVITFPINTISKSLLLAIIPLLCMILYLLQPFSDACIENRWDFLLLLII
jgi:hypothetical protein